MNELIQANCKKVGITVNVTAIDMGTWVQTMFDDTAYDMYVGRIENGPTSISLAFYTPLDVFGAGSYKNYEYEGKEWVDSIKPILYTEDDISIRKSTNYDLAKIMSDEVLWFNIVTTNYSLAINENLAGNIRNGYGGVALYQNLYWK